MPEQQLLGWYDDAEYTKQGEFVPPPGTNLPTVRFKYVPLRPNAKQKLLADRERSTTAQALRLSVTLVAKQVKSWDMRTPNGDTAPIDAKLIGAHMDDILVEGIADVIYGSGATEEAESELADFPAASE